MGNRAALLVLCFLVPLAAGAQETTAPAAMTSSSESTTSSPSTTASSTSASATTGTATATPARPDSVPTDGSKEWRVGICVFSSDGLSPDNSYLPYSLPLLLKNEVSGLTSHSYAEAETDGLRRFLIRTEVATAEKTLSAARRDHDALLFNRVAEGASDRTAVATRLAAAEARLGFLRSMDPSRIDISPRKPVTFPEGTGAGKLLAAPTVPRRIYCVQQNLDLLVGGSLREVQGYLLLDIWAYDPLSDRAIFSSRNAATRDELYATMPAFGDEIARTILGREWAVVDYSPDPPSADLYVDGRRVASGATPALYLSPGEHEIRISAAGYRDVYRPLSLPPEKQTVVSDSLEKDTIGEIAVTSEPAGADLYVDSQWRGRTPLALDRPALRSRGVLARDGYYNLNFSLEPQSPSELSFSLEKDAGPKDARQKKARDDFYTSLTFFALSVPLPVLSYGLLIDSQVKQVDLSSAGLSSALAREQRTGTILQGTYYVGVAVSVALFTWMVTRILNYVKVADEIAG